LLKGGVEKGKNASEKRNENVNGVWSSGTHVKKS
jgi:hypothetical protein